MVRVRGSMVYASDGHPAGRSVSPWLQIRRGAVYPVLDHPMAGAVRPWYLIDAGRVVPTFANPDPMVFTALTVDESPTPAPMVNQN